MPERKSRKKNEETLASELVRRGAEKLTGKAMETRHVRDQQTGEEYIEIRKKGARSWKGAPRIKASDLENSPSDDKEKH